MKSKRYIANFSNKSPYILVGGDFNARTGIISEIEASDNLNNGETFDILKNSIDVSRLLVEKGISKRSSMDAGNTNHHGIELISMCKSTSMVILNGRMYSDKGIRAYTRIDTTGSSLVDYVLSSSTLLDLIDNFCVKPKFPESDHLPINMVLLSMCGLAQEI